MGSRDAFVALMEAAAASRWGALPIGDRVAAVGRHLLGVPYVAGTLDRKPGIEACSVLLDQLDCVTLFETSLGVARMLAKGGTTIEELVSEVTLTRYRGGLIDGYASRLHYTCDWIRDNVAKGVVSNVTAAMPGARREFIRFDYMSAHRESYAALARDEAELQKIVRIERGLSAEAFAWVPKADVARCEPLLQSGDIVGITTSVSGLDCSHTGLCVREGPLLRLLHASSTAGKVVLDGRLSELLSRSQRQTGIVVARPLEAKRSVRS